MPKLLDFAPSRGNLLLLGPPGAGKTTLLSMLTERGYVLECDGNVKGPANYLRTNGLTTNCEFVLPHIGLDGKPIPHKDRWDKMCELGSAAINSGQYDMCAVDSLLTFNDFAMDKVRVLNKKRPTTSTAPGEQISQPDWGTFYALVKNFLVELKTASGNMLTVVTAHIATDKDDLQGFLKYFVAIPGALREQIAGLFDEVWKLSVEEKNGKSVHYIQAVPSIREDSLGLKSSLGISGKREINFKELSAFFRS